jgi:hypothetical protein
MLAFLDLATGAAILLVGYVGGRVHRPRRSDSVSIAECACSHSLGEHHEKTGACLAQAERPHYHENGSRNGFEWVPCVCMRYVAPRPVDELFSIKHLPPSDQ